ncbi:hypothetical protein [Kineothrix sedimenti]|uniref:Uncharacterized protein n=1 Tax=Kineothrix sedimenti TaxID=3123317 RepID=A0ABZ3EPU2_9FIRM
MRSAIEKRVSRRTFESEPITDPEKGEIVSLISELNPVGLAVLLIRKN